MAVQKTLGIIKPNAVERRLVGAIAKAIEDGGLRIVAMRMLRLTKERACAFYAVHEGKPFYEGLVEFMSSGPIVAMVLEGEDAIAKWREIMGATDPTKAAPGTIRHDFCLEVGRNLTHASDSPENGLKEAALWFKPAETVAWKRAVDPWIFE